MTDTTAPASNSYQVWPLARILRDVSVGSGDWTWAEEFAELADDHRDRVAALEQQIAAQGITTPVLIGNDGRLWDGHHRLLVASRLGIAYVPVEIVPPAEADIVPDNPADNSGTETASAQASAPAEDPLIGRMRLTEAGRRVLSNVDGVTVHEGSCSCGGHFPTRHLHADQHQPINDLVHAGWYCWRCHAINATACRSDAVPIHVPAEWREDMEREIERRENGDFDEPTELATPAPSPNETAASVGAPDDGLREQYAAAMRTAVSDAPGEMTDEEELVIDDLAEAVMAVRDNRMEELRDEAERLKLLVAVSSEPGHAVRMAAEHAGCAQRIAKLERLRAGQAAGPASDLAPDELERRREQLMDAMSGVSEDRWAASWLIGLDKILHAESGIWETIGREVGWPVFDYNKRPWDEAFTWMSWDEAGSHYAERSGR